MKPFLKFFQGSSIQSKLLLYFSTLILLPMVTLGLLGNIIYSRSIEYETNVHTVQMIDQVKKNIEFYITDMENIIYYISRDPVVMQFFEMENSDGKAGADIENEVHRVLKTYTEVHPEIAGILLVNENDLSISNEMYRIARDPLITETWYKKAIGSPENIQLISKPIGRNIANRFNYSADDVVSVVKAIRPVKGEKCSGIILIDLKLDIIKKVIEDITLGKNGFLYIADAQGGIVYAPVNKIVYRVKDEWLEKAPSNSIVKTIKDSKYQIIYKDSSYTGWKTVGVFSLNETLKEVTNIRYYSLVIAFLTLLLAAMAAIIFTGSIAKPLKKLRKLMKRAEEGDLDVHFESKYNDEIGQLGKSFNTMIYEIRKLINMVYSEQKSKREAELKTLQAQIKPHFLYNTLDTIQWMAQGHGANDIVEIVGALTNLFRIGLSKGKEMISVKEEFDHVKSYLIIMKARYEDKLEYEIDIEERILDLKVLKLILQPLVENAIYHGIKEKRGPGRINIKGMIRDNKLYFSVSDNGAGISPEKLKELEILLSGSKSGEANTGYGTFNVSERIRLSFGTDYGIRFDSSLGKGTTVEVWHPIVER